MRLTENFSENCILIDYAVDSKDTLMNTLITKLCEEYQIEEKDSIKEAVLSRERKMSTGIGCGLAVPHAKVDFIQRMCIGAMTVKKGVDFSAIDNEPVFLIFLIVSPSDTTGPHIRALSAISRIMADAEIRKGLTEAKSAKEFYQILRLGEEKYI